MKPRAPEATPAAATRSTVFRSRSEHPGLYLIVDLNGWTLVSEEPPPDRRAVLLGYRALDLPEIWYGVGYRDAFTGCYWLGPRGETPHYQRIETGAAIVWRSFEKVLGRQAGRPDQTTDYVQWPDLVGEEKL